VRDSCSDYKKGKLTLDEINERTFKDFLVTKDIPDPDLLIRTGGDYRISNFLLWEMAYTELYFDRTFWPVFRRENLYRAITEYQGRERRYGMTTKQIQKKTKG
jgi:undecaprenyl diphosphate synthase